ncbi:MAG: DedA family protein [Deltaproteobacteria bacterium]|nr:DedA family protein [Deltaproteobacteria bacterium]
MITTVIDLFVHLDRHLADFVAQFGVWIYGLLFAIVFCETGLVVTPFLPGDSLLFAAGAIAAAGGLDPWLVGVLLAVAAILGDAVNYSVGRYVGPRVFRAEDLTGFWHKALNRKHLDRAHAFFEKYGGKAIALGRFVPIVRTFVPFVAGAASMTYRKFALYNIGGGVVWVSVCVGAGYAFGNVPLVKNNFSLVALAIVVVSVLPIAIEMLRHKTGAAAASGSS